MIYGVFALLFANIIWGAGAPIFKEALTDVPPFTLAFIRFFGASLILLPFILRYKKPLEKHDFAEIIIGAFFGITINISFFFLGLQRAPSINYPIINSAGPIFLFFISILLFKEKIQKKVLIGLLMSLLGVLIIILSPLFVLSNGLAWGKFEGNLFIMIAVVGAVLQPVLLRNVLKKIDPIIVTSYAFIFGALSFVPFMLWESQSWSITELNKDGLAGIIYGIFGSSLMVYTLFHFGVSKMKLQEVGIFSYASPIAAVVVAMFYNEYPILFYYIGTALTFLGTFIAEEKLHHHKLHHHLEKRK